MIGGECVVLEEVVDDVETVDDDNAAIAAALVAHSVEEKLKRAREHNHLRDLNVLLRELLHEMVVRRVADMAKMQLNHCRIRATTKESIERAKERGDDIIEEKEIR